MDIKRTPAEWEQVTGIRILDPDGWDRKNFEVDWAIPLTEKEFIAKAFTSTIIDRSGYFARNGL